MKTMGATPVTRVGTDTARRRAKRFALPLVGGIITLFLAACSSSSSSNNIISSLTSSPQQTEQAEQKGQVKPVAFAPVIGAPAKVSSKVNQRLTAAAAQSNIPVKSSGDADYTIRGYLVAASDPKGTKLSYIWDITDKSGKRAKRFQGDELIEGKKGGDPWALIDDGVIDRLASSPTSKISNWMSASGPAAPATAAAATPATTNATKPAQQAKATKKKGKSGGVLSAQAAETPKPAAAAAASTRKNVILAVVPPVKGAPGDGKTSLTSAMRRHLQNAGVKLANGNASDAYTVKGTVQLGSAASGQQPITIRWLVVDPAGKTMEKAVVQRNKVPAGSLNGSWGQIADLAAGEAAKSVAKLIKPAG